MPAAVTRARQRQRGITLLELVVAILVLSIGTIAAMRSLDQSGRVLGQETSRILAREVAANRAAELSVTGAAAGRDLPREVEMGGATWRVETAEAKTRAGLVEVTITVSAPDRPGALLTSFVPVVGPE